MSKKIAIVLSGCGNKDGSEITEATSLIISLSSLGAELSFYSLNKNFVPKNFLTQEALSETRNLLLESARISRGNIHDLQDIDVNKFDGLAIPGGYGAALHLCDWAAKGSRCEVDSHLTSIIKEFHAQSKPIAAICIAPVILAKVLGNHQVTLTVGAESEVSREIEKTGAIHEICPLTDFITDRENKVITTPAYMYDSAKPHEVFLGIQGLAKEFMEMA